MKKQISLIEKAMRIAVVAHVDQKRKSDNSPYIVHPMMTAFKLIKHNFSDEVVAGAIMHDVLEDTDFSEEDILKELGENVLKIIKGVTENKELPWEERKQDKINSIKNSPEEIKAVAVVDKIHNAESLLFAHQEKGPSIWEKFNRGRDKKIWFEKEFLNALKENWQHPLVDEYTALVEKLEKLD